MKLKRLSVFIILLLFLGGFTFAFLSKKVHPSFKITNNKIQKTFKDGDIIFQTSESAQCEAVRIATNSKFSHCGIIFIEKEKTYVYEAVQPVKKTQLEEWIKQGRDQKYVVKRLQNNDSLLTKDMVKKMKLYATTLMGKDYDLYFEWSDEKIYCSELVWKIYKEVANVSLCPTKKLKDFNLVHPLVQKIMKERYGNNIPYDEEVVAPSQLYDSNLVTTVFDNY
ncbi:Peptidoglycan peptidase [Flavobacterium sp. 9AF]|uniref:YiiX family permuted papain-like enzyme n=1 Tax=Flavobacterium sp. 9AF TaxID=2653142 RepID=UPI0012EEFF74|nr:YiiX family permuted papain-like enzyme [Flavobacterium sp. 9AF]VXB69629.1 Peptidoglycan peptidase [Flavobacterium sp. 9AF]